MSERLVTATGVVVDVAPTSDGDRAELLALFRAIVAAGEGYPQAPDEPVTDDGFERYWSAPARDVHRPHRYRRRAGRGVHDEAERARARRHVANAGYIVADGHRGQGIGEALVRHSFDAARAHGFDAMQFNFVFETNPARRLYERLGFVDIGAVPDVIDGEAVHIYWRRL